MMYECAEHNGLEGLPVSWQRYLLIAAIGKAMMAGAGVGIACLGALDLAFAISAEQWWEAVKPDAIVNWFAVGGTVVGFVARVITDMVT